MNIPLLLLVFNRPKETSNLLNALQKIKPSKIYINQDGPRKGNLDDINLSNEVIELIKKKIDWNVEIKKKINSENKGLKKSVEGALNWFFDNENCGIILEDDCIPNKQFFNFCSKMLIEHELNDKIFSISGSNFIYNNYKIEEDFFYSKYAHCWGWATWKRAWKKYDGEFKDLEKFLSSDLCNIIHQNKLEKKYWSKIFKNVSSGKIKSWAFPWLFSIWKNNGLNILPNRNLVENIGFGPNATNTINYLNKKVYDTNDSDFTFKKIPKKNLINKEADKMIFEIHFNGKYNFYPWRVLFLTKLFFKDPRTFLLKLINKING